ncbi:MAG: Holliday junction resolvase RuvX [Pseudanabaenaceae cyanobacterium]
MELVKALGLDIGKKRIGVAGCDRLGLLAFRITTIYRKSWLADMTALQKIIAEREIDTLVVGMPYNMDGTIGEQAYRIEKYAHRVADYLQMKLEFVDERLTSFSAESMLREMGYKLKDNKALIDQQSAVIILQQWLDQKRHLYSNSKALED